MELQNLIQRISSDYPALQASIGFNRPVFGLNRWIPESVGETSLRPDLLYYFEGDGMDLERTLQAQPNLQLPFSLIYLSSASGRETETTAFAAIRNRVLIPKADKDAVLTALRNMLEENHRFDAFGKRFLLSILNGENLSPCLSELADKLGASIVLFNLSGKILAHSSPFRIQDSLWTQSIRQGYCPSRFMEHVENIHHQLSPEEMRRPRCYYCREMRFHCQALPVFHRRALYAYLFMLRQDAKFPPESEVYLKWISETLGKQLLRRHPVDSGEQELTDELLADLLHGIPEEEAYARIQSSQIHFPDSMRVLLMRPRYVQDMRDILRSGVSKMEKIIPIRHKLIFEKQLVLIIESLPEPGRQPQIREQLAHFCRQNFLIAGISHPFRQAAQLDSYYHQAEHAICLVREMGIPTDVCDYADIAFFDLIRGVAENVDPSRFSHPVLDVLFDYDRQHDTKLYETLRVYTRCGFNQAACAKKLYIHRNTLNYRRQKIMDLSGLNLDDPSVRFALSYSFAIRRYLEKDRR